MDSLLRDKRQQLKNQLDRRQRRAFIKAQPVLAFNLSSLLTMSLQQLIELISQKNNQAIIALGNRIIDDNSLAIQALDLGLEKIELKGHTAAWLIDICVGALNGHPSTSSLLPLLDIFLGSKIQKQVLYSLYSLNDILMMLPHLLPNIFKLKNFSLVRSYIYHEQSEIHKTSSLVLTHVAACSQSIARMLVDAGLLRDLLFIIQSNQKNIRARGLQCLGFLAQLDHNILRLITQSQQLRTMLFQRIPEDLYVVRRQFYGFLEKMVRESSQQDIKVLLQYKLLALINKGLQPVEIELQHQHILFATLRMLQHLLNQFVYWGEEDWLASLKDHLERTGMQRRVTELYDCHAGRKVVELCERVLNLLQSE